MPVVPEHCEQSYHLFYMLMPSLESRTRLIERLRERGILAVFHYLPLHLSTVGKQLGGREGQCPVTEDVCDRLLRLPLFNTLSEPEQAEVIEAVVGFDV
jgi:dTDP-4-amino-4,6-dideoxygalactose transaminase